MTDLSSKLTGANSSRFANSVGDNGFVPRVRKMARFRGKQSPLEAISDGSEQTESFPVTKESLALNPVLPVSTFPEQSPFDRFWKAYLELLEDKPILVKSCTSLFGFMIGDICAQAIIGAKYDVLRTLRLTLFGILMDGPIGHCWYLFLDKNVFPETPTVPKAIVVKTALDQLVWAPFFSCVFFAFNQLLQGHPDLIIPTIKDTLVPTLTANYALWPLAHLINFKFIPSQQRILYINVVQILWTSYLSNLAAHSASVVSVHKRLSGPASTHLTKTVHHHLINHSYHHGDFFHTFLHHLHIQ
eukprot:g8244.t1